MPARRTTWTPQLAVSFCRYVGGAVGLAALEDAPGVYEDGQINPAWRDHLTSSRMKVAPHPIDSERQVLRPNRIPGALMFDPEAHEWIPVDDSSPIGQVGRLSQAARALLEKSLTEPLIDTEEKAFLRSARVTLVEIYNNYATARFNGAREVVNGADFRGVTLRHLAGISLVGVRSDLLRTAEQTRHPSLFDRCEALNTSGIRTPTRVDQFLRDIFVELSRAEANPQAAAPLST